MDPLDPSMYTIFTRDLESAVHARLADGVLPSANSLAKARSSLLHTLPDDGIGALATSEHILNDLVPGLNGQGISPNYYGFVVGGITPAATLAEAVVSRFDQNVQVHLPTHSAATDVERAGLALLADLLELPSEHFPHRTFTTGATASNILGLACAREAVIEYALRRAGYTGDAASVGQLGLLHACRAAGIDEIRVLTTFPHSSLGKAASIVGLGRASVVLVHDTADPRRVRFDFARLRSECAKPRTASIICVSAGEVNTGGYATCGEEDVRTLRAIADEFGAWIHVDGAFGLFARILPKDDPQWRAVRAGTEGLELADSIGGDGHKMLNVPYDCGFFFAHDADLAVRVFQNAGAAYLAGGAQEEPSPLNIGIENSRRFRALPVYASLRAYGRVGYRDIVARQVSLARAVACFISAHSAYELLPAGEYDAEKIFMIVLFRATDPAKNVQLVQLINETRRIYVSGTSWDGTPACRIAVSGWQVDVERDLEVVKGVLEEVARTS